jgi:hypothetical protein
VKRGRHWLIAGTLLALMISLWLGSDGVIPPSRKLVLIVQVALPLMGLLVGQLVPDRGNKIAC